MCEEEPPNLAINQFELSQGTKKRKAKVTETTVETRVQSKVRMGPASVLTTPLSSPNSRTSGSFATTNDENNVPQGERKISTSHHSPSKNCNITATIFTNKGPPTSITNRSNWNANMNDTSLENKRNSPDASELPPKATISTRSSPTISAESPRKLNNPAGSASASAAMTSFAANTTGSGLHFRSNAVSCRGVNLSSSLSPLRTDLTSVTSDADSNDLNIICEKGAPNPDSALRRQAVPQDSTNLTIGDACATQELPAEALPTTTQKSILTASSATALPSAPLQLVGEGTGKKAPPANLLPRNPKDNSVARTPPRKFVHANTASTTTSQATTTSTTIGNSVHNSSNIINSAKATIAEASPTATPHLSIMTTAIHSAPATRDNHSVLSQQSIPLPSDSADDFHWASKQQQQLQLSQQQEPQQLQQQLQHIIHTSSNSVGQQQHHQSSSSQSGLPQHHRPEADDQEQALFEQRLCEDVYGVAVRKINHNGKSNLRYVKCCWMDAYELENDVQSTSRSVGSRVSRSGFTNFSRRSAQRERSETESLSNRDYLNNNKAGKKKVLTWGKKKDVRIAVERFVCVRKGKTTDRSKRNTCAANQILSLITDDSAHPALDIEAPTRLDRDKFARAFARFLKVSIEGEDSQSVTSNMTPFNVAMKASSKSTVATKRLSANVSVPDKHGKVPLSSSVARPNAGITKHMTSAPLPMVTTARPKNEPDHPLQFDPNEQALHQVHNIPQSSSGSQPRPQAPPGPRVKPKAIDVNTPSEDKQHRLSLTDKSAGNPQSITLSQNGKILKNLPSSLSKPHSSNPTSTRSQAFISTKTPKEKGDDADDGTVVSSLTGAGFDQEIVEEMHQALTELRLELEESRAEASRAVKVAEQAIQSAENSTAKDWNSTVTHKAAEAAAQAQKRSAEAMAKQRMAEERVQIERKNVAYWRQQAESAEEQAGALQTRAASAEVQRAIMEEALESEKLKSSQLTDTLRQELASSGSSSPGKGIHDRIKAFENLTSPSSDGHAEQDQVRRLKEKLAMENALRRKLQHEVQDLRGAVRVYCRPRPPKTSESTISISSKEVLILHRDKCVVKGEKSIVNTFPLSFEFDGIFDHEMGQKDVYNEVEAICLGALDGYNICAMTHGQSNAGKTHTMLGDVSFVNDDADPHKISINNQGIHLQCVEQLFAVIKRRSERYEDSVSLSIVEVHDERLSDLLVETPVGTEHGVLTVDDSRRAKSRKKVEIPEEAQGSPTSKASKLEIKTNHNGETIVQGSLSVEVANFDDVLQVWNQCLGQRASKLAQQGTDLKKHESSSHLIATIKVTSTNTSSGIGTIGKIQFVDLAGSDVSSRKLGKDKRPSTPEAMLAGIGNSQEWKFSNKSVETLSQVVDARSQFTRTVPYRNSTLTHLLRDSLEGDTKVVVVACVSSDPEDMQNTACTLRMVAKMRKIIVGTATKHMIAD